MRSIIQAVCGAGMALAVSLVVTPSSASAQEATVHHRIVTQTTHILCGDGTWARSGNPECRGHDGVAQRQTTTTSVNPRGTVVGGYGSNSTVAGGYGSNSTVVRGYDNRVRANAIARCADRTYWHARRRGSNACIDHGGVARWYY